jgi:hypothetical protein
MSEIIVSKRSRMAVTGIISLVVAFFILTIAAIFMYDDTGTPVPLTPALSTALWTGLVFLCLGLVLVAIGYFTGCSRNYKPSFDFEYGESRLLCIPKHSLPK